MVPPSSWQARRGPGHRKPAVPKKGPQPRPKNGPRLGENLHILGPVFGAAMWPHFWGRLSFLCKAAPKEGPLYGPSFGTQNCTHGSKKLEHQLQKKCIPVTFFCILGLSFLTPGPPVSDIQPGWAPAADPAFHRPRAYRRLEDGWLCNLATERFTTVPSPLATNWRRCHDTLKLSG